MLPKNGPIAEVKFVPLIVKPAIVVATPAVSCSRSEMLKPVADWEVEFGTTESTTLEFAAPVTVTVPVEPLKTELPPYVAVTELLPAVRTLPLIAKDAVAAGPEAVNEAVPSIALPSVKVTVPEGTVLPEAALTVAVRSVVAVCAIVVELAVTVVVVLISAGGAVTVTVAEAADPEKLPVAV